MDRKAKERAIVEKISDMMYFVDDDTKRIFLGDYIDQLSEVEDFEVDLLYKDNCTK